MKYSGDIKTLEYSKIDTKEKLTSLDKSHLSWE